MDTLKRYEVLHSDENVVIFRDLGKSGYDPPVCYDRKTGKFRDMTTHLDDPKWEVDWSGRGSGFRVQSV